MTGAARAGRAAARSPGRRRLRAAVAPPAWRRPAGVPIEVVRAALPADGLGRRGARPTLDRFRRLVVGHGLGHRAEVAARRPRGRRRRGPRPAGRGRRRRAHRPRAPTPPTCVGPSTVLTPHDGEFARLAGAAPGADRIAAARALAAAHRRRRAAQGPDHGRGRRPTARCCVTTTGDAAAGHRRHRRRARRGDRRRCCAAGPRPVRGRGRRRVPPRPGRRPRLAPTAWSPATCRPPCPPPSPRSAAPASPDPRPHAPEDRCCCETRPCAT